MVAGTALFVVLNGLVFGSLIALTAVGLSLVFGVLDIPNFAQGEFATFGGLATVFLYNRGLGLLPSAAVAVVLTALAGVLVERLVFARFYGREEFLLFAFFASFGLVVFFEELLLAGLGADVYQVQIPIEGSVELLDVTVRYLEVAAAGIAVAMLLGLYLFTRYTYYGLAMRAIADDADGAAVVGIDRARIYALTFGLGAALTGVTGILYGSIFTLFPTLGIELTGFAFAIVVVGGVGSFQGTVFASLLIGVIDSFAATVFGSRYRLLAVFLVLFAVLIFRPEGLFGDTDA
jgi:branched-chain amino acid transport system permease protein